jgi:DNA invertase Pin-like site-specific DNA recombinase
MPNAYSYIRFSSAVQEYGHSVERQTKLRNDWLEQHPEYVLSDAMIDKGLSGYTAENIDIGLLGAFYDQIRAGDIPKDSVLLVENLDRLGRDEVIDAMQRFLSVLQAGVDIVTFEPEEHFSKKTTRPEQLMMALVCMMRANEESARKAQRIGAVWQKKKEDAINGKPMSRFCPQWLKVEDDKFVVVPAGAAIIQRIFKLSIDGQGAQNITKILNGEGLKTLGRNCAWSAASVNRVLTSKAVYGYYQPHKGSQKKKTRKPVGDPIPNYYPAIVSEEDYYRCQQAMQARRHVTSPGIKRTANLFTRLAICPRCGGNMVAINGGPQSTMKFRCSNAARHVCVKAGIQYSTVEKAILASLKEIDPKELIPTKNKNNETKVALAVAEGRKAEVASKIKTLKKEIKKRPIAALFDVAAELEEEGKELTQQIERLKMELASREGSTLAQLQDLIGMAHDEAYRAKLKALIRDVVESIYVLVVCNENNRLRKALIQVKIKGVEGLREIKIQHYYPHEALYSVSTFKKNGIAVSDLQPKMDDLRDYDPWLEEHILRTIHEDAKRLAK